MNAWFGIISLAVHYFFNQLITWGRTFQLIWNLHSPAKFLAMLSPAGKFKRELCTTKEIICVRTHNSSLVLTVNTWTANFVHGIIKCLICQRVFLQSVASIHLNKDGIYAQLRWKHTSPWWRDCVTDFTHLGPLGRQSWKDCLVTKFYCFLPSVKYRMLSVCKNINWQGCL